MLHLSPSPNARDENRRLRRFCIYFGGAPLLVTVLVKYVFGGDGLPWSSAAEVAVFIQPLIALVVYAVGERAVKS